MKILLVDDHQMMRDGLRAVLEKEPDLRVVAEAANGHDALRLALEVKPEIVIMDISMPGLNGIDATRRILARQPEIKVVALSTNANRSYVVAMFEAGAAGYVIKLSAAAELIRAVRCVANNQVYVSPAVAGVVIGALTASEGDTRSPSDGQLSSREREVLQLLAEGHSSKSIAVQLTIAVSTVESHRRQIMDKLGLRSVAELTKYAVREGLTSIDK